MKRNVLTVGFDENCRFCQRFSNWIKRLDTRHRIEASGARTTKDPLLMAIPLSLRTQILHATDGKQIFTSWRAIAEIFYRIPLLSFLYWPMCLFSRLPFSDRLYQFIANRRACTKNQCQIGEPK